jgi:hypothetical protein
MYRLIILPQRQVTEACMSPTVNSDRAKKSVWPVSKFFLKFPN